MPLWKPWKKAINKGDDAEIPGYRVLDEAGRGGFAIVYRAVQERLNRTVAVKVLSTQIVDETVLARFQRECELTGRLTGHPNVVTVLDTGMTRSGRPFVVTEYFERGSLKKRLDETGPLPVNEALHIGVKIAGALAAAHEAGILHRDVKPQNILVSRYGEPALADFGVARLLNSGETSTATRAITPYHAAPELLDGDPPSRATDTYALGSTLYQLLAGRPAFQRENDEGVAPVLRRISNEDPPEIARTDVPRQVDELVRQVMAKSPAERIGDPLVLARAIQRIQEDLGHAVTELPTSEESSARTARETAMATALDSSVRSSASEDTAARQGQPAVPDSPTPEDPGFSATVLRPQRKVSPAKPERKRTGRNRRRLIVTSAAAAALSIVVASVVVLTGRDDDQGTVAAKARRNAVAGSSAGTPSQPAASPAPTPSTGEEKPVGPGGDPNGAAPPPAGGGTGGSGGGGGPNDEAASAGGGTDGSGGAGGPDDGAAPPAGGGTNGSGGGNAVRSRSGKSACRAGDLCIWSGANYQGTRYSYRYGKEDWNWHDGVVSAPANQDFSWYNNTSGPLVVQIYQFGGNNRGGLRVPTICLRPGASASSSAAAGGQGSGHLFQQKCHPDSKVIA